MSFDPTKWFLGSLEVFGVLIPGSVAVFAGRAVAVHVGVIPSAPWPSSTLDWSILLVAGFVVGFLAHPPAHILNKLYDVTYRRWQRRRGDPLLEYARRAAKPHISSTGSVYAWARAELLDKAPAALAVVDRTEGISKGFRTLAFLSAIAAVVAATTQLWLWAGSLVLLFILSFFVFAERRFSASCTIYQAFRRVHEQPTSPPK